MHPEPYPEPLKLPPAKFWLPLTLSFLITAASGVAAFWETPFAVGAICGGVLMLISMFAWWDEG